MTAIVAAAIADGHIILSCAGVGGEWRRIASINISAGDDCPTGWNKSSYNGVSFCRSSSNRGCHSTFFPTNGVSYQKVCGRARGYQQGPVNGFLRNTYTIDNEYVDGLSITHGNPRQHIWTYATGTDNYSYNNWNCRRPCAVTPGPTPPSFVGNNYYCESGTVDTYSNAYYFSDPLWDGAGCSASNTCCSNTNQPWFYHQLSGMTQDDIEVRICIVGVGATLVDILDLYIQ